LEHRITKYPLEQGALEIEYIEEFFGEYKRRKIASEIVGRLQNRDHLILMAMAPLPDDPGTVVPVSYKVAHEIRAEESIPKLADLVVRLRDYIKFDDRRILYTWIGGTRRDWRGQGHFRALTEQQEAWAIENGFDEILVKTKNRFYEMRGTLDHLHFNVVKYEPHADNQESKVYLSKKLGQEVLDAHRSMRKVVTVRAE
jgi:GNAT superfamily N-acetyltransferase